MSTVKQIRDGINATIESVTDFNKLDNKFLLEKNNFTNQKKRYGVIADDGVLSDSQLLRHVGFDRVFEITLCNQFISTLNKDQDQEQIGDILESAMETIIDNLYLSKVGLPNLVNTINFANNNRVDYDEIENLAILRFSMVVQYRKQIASC